MEHQPRIDRRTALGMLGGLGAMAALAACGDSSSTSSTASTTSPSASGTTGTSASSTTTGASQVDCVLTPEVTEGPYYLDLNTIRADITEGKDGAPLALTITVVDATSCEPIKDAAVDIWHCDAEGVYSGFESGAGETFLRGTQVTAADGTATFNTIYPGWYRGRAVHIHMKVHVDDTAVHTGQLFFDDARSETVYADSAYGDRGAPDTPNTSDSIYREAGAAAAQVALQPNQDGYTATITVGVQPS